MNETSTTNLVQQGLTAARVGDMDEARRLLTEATEQDPNNIEAWLGLAGVVETLTEKKHCFDRVLSLDPDHAEAQAGLALIEQKLMPDSSATGEEQADTGLAFCYRHPQTETALRCNRCNKPICPKCARRTPVGFRCPDCIREQENKYYSGTNLDYVIAVVIALPLSLITAGLIFFILGSFGFWSFIIGFFVAPAVGGFIAEAVRWGVRKRRSRYLRYIVVGCLVLGVLPFALIALIAGGGIVGLGILGLFLFLGAGTILARLR